MGDSETKDIKVDKKPVDVQSLLNQPNIRNFMNGLIRKGMLEIKPTLDKSGIKYLVAEAFLNNKDSILVNNALKDWAKQGLFKSKIIDRTLLCPSCNSPEVHSKFVCPRCSFTGIALTQLVEHKTCGYIGAQSDFLKEDSIICPRCATDLSNSAESYRIIGDFYQCENCGNRFDKPEVVHVCQNCGKSSTFREIKYTEIVSYRISDYVMEKLAGELPILENIRHFFEQIGFIVKLRSELVGASGVLSPFDVIAEKENIRIVIDASVEGNKNDIVALLAKKMDVNPSKVLLLDLSGGQELQVLGNIYGIDVISTGANQSLSEETKKLLIRFVGSVK